MCLQKERTKPCWLQGTTPHGNINWRRTRVGPYTKKCEIACHVSICANAKLKDIPYLELNENKSITEFPLCKLTGE